MKTFYASLVTFTLLLLLIGANAVYIRKTATKLEEHLTTLLIDGSSFQEMDELETYWERRKPFVSLSMPSEVVWSISDRIIEIRSAVTQQDKDGLDLAVRLAIEDVSRMKNTEGFSIETLL